jgi:hypothetical protein
MPLPGSAARAAERPAQAAMRYSDSNLTMNTYTDPKLLDVRAQRNHIGFAIRAFV